MRDISLKNRFTERVSTTKVDSLFLKSSDHADRRQKFWHRIFDRLFTKLITKANVPLPAPSNSSTPLYRRCVIRKALGIFFCLLSPFLEPHKPYLGTRYHCHTRSLNKFTKDSETWSKQPVDTFSKTVCRVRCSVPVAEHGGASASRFSGVIVAPAKIRGYI